MKNPNAPLLTRKRRVEHLARDEAAVRRKNQHHNAEFAPLCFMHRDGVGQLQVWLAVFRESRPREREIPVVATCEFNVSERGAAFSPQHLTSDHANFAVRKEFLLTGFLRIKDVRRTPVIADADHLIAINNLLCAARLDEPHPVPVMRNLVGLDGVLQSPTAQAVLDPPIEKYRTAGAVPIDAQDLPVDALLSTDG